MPDNSGKLSTDEIKQAIAWLTERGVGGKCPACGHPDMTLSDLTVQMPAYVGGSMLVSGPQMPAVALICMNCAHIQLHNAIMVGLVKTPTKPKTDSLDALQPKVPAKGGTDGN